MESSEPCMVQIPVMKYPYTRTTQCTEPASRRVTDAEGVTGLACERHAVTIERQASADH
jgi:hypothetical protein